MVNGEELVVDEEIDLDIKLNGHCMPITFSELPVSCPILSVQHLVRRGKKVVFTGGGGHMLHKATGNKIQLVEREGVCFVKIKKLANIFDVQCR